jgi:hypothetical protein
MNIRRGYSDSKLIQHLQQGPRAKFDEDNLDNFLPKFLIKDMNTKDEKKVESTKANNKEYELDMEDFDKCKTIFDTNESEDLNEYLKQLSIKEVKIIKYNFRISILKLIIDRSFHEVNFIQMLI